MSCTYSRPTSNKHLTNKLVIFIVILSVLKFTPVVSQCASNTRPRLLTGSGTISSPNYPYDYPHNSDCQWRLTASYGVIEITLPSYATERSLDGISIHDGYSINSPQMALLSGISSTSLTYRSSQAYMYVRFQSDATVSKNGFTATFRSTNGNYCASSPCYNGATCVDDDYGFRCRCSAGYTGSRCDSSYVAVNNMNGYWGFLSVPILLVVVLYTIRKLCSVPVMELTRIRTGVQIV